MKNNDEAPDWRLSAPHNYLCDTTAKYEEFKSQGDEDHEHCAFCWDKISNYDGDLSHGYHIVGTSDWICEECFNDFHVMFSIKDITKKENEQ